MYSKFARILAVSDISGGNVDLGKQKIYQGLKWGGGTIVTAVIGVFVTNSINTIWDSMIKKEKEVAVSIQNGRNVISIGRDILSRVNGEIYANGDLIIDNQQLTNIYHSEQWRTFESQREKLQQKIAKYPNYLDFRQELNDLEKQMQTFKQDVLLLAKQLEQKTIDDERFKQASKYFENGEYKLVNELLDEQELSNEQVILLEKKAENIKKLKDNATSFILKAGFTAIDYSLKSERISRAKSLFEKALVSDRSPNNLFEYGVFLQKNNQFSKANKFYKEALEGYRELAKQNPELYLPYVEKNLNNLALLASKDVSRWQEAEKYYKEALKIRRELAIQNPKLYLSGLAEIDALNNLARLLSNDSSRRQEADEYYQEALKLSRELAQKDPIYHSPILATVLFDFAHVKFKWQENEQALQFLAELESLSNNQPWGGLLVEKIQELKKKISSTD